MIYKYLELRRSIDSSLKLAASFILAMILQCISTITGLAVRSERTPTFSTRVITCKTLLCGRLSIISRRTGKGRALS